jgi:hypothetical protein
VSPVSIPLLVYFLKWKREDHGTSLFIFYHIDTVMTTTAIELLEEMPSNSKRHQTPSAGGSLFSTARTNEHYTHMIGYKSRHNFAKET